MADSLTLSFRPIFLEDLGTSNTLAQTQTTIMGVGTATVTAILAAASDTAAAAAGLNAGDVYFLNTGAPNRFRTNLLNFNPPSIATGSIVNSGTLSNSGLATFSGGVAVTGQNIQLQNGAALDLNNQSVIGNGTFTGNVNLNGGTTLGAALNLNGQSVSGVGTISGDPTFSGNATFPGATTFSGTIAFPAGYAPSFGSSNTFTGTTTFGGPVVVDNDVQVTYNNSTNSYASQRIYTDTSSNLVIDSASASGSWLNALKITPTGLIQLPNNNISVAGAYATFYPTISSIIGGSISGYTITEAAAKTFGPWLHLSLQFQLTIGASAVSVIQFTGVGVSPLHGFSYTAAIWQNTMVAPIGNLCIWSAANTAFQIYAPFSANTTYNVWVNAYYSTVS